jgi:hypothetical protein
MEELKRQLAEMEDAIKRADRLIEELKSYLNIEEK